MGKSKNSYHSVDAPRVRVKTAHSTVKATEAAILEITEQLQQPNTSVVALFASPSFDLEVLARRIHENFDAPVIGCTTSGEITPDGYAQGTITGFSIASKEMEVQTHFIPEVRELDSLKIDQVVESIRQRLSRVLKAWPEARSFGLLFIDGLSYMEEQVVAMLGNALEDVPIIGGSAGDDLNFTRTYIYHQGQFAPHAATFTLITTTLPFRIIKTQHFVPTDERLVITRAVPERRLVLEINGLPAAEEYARIVEKKIEELKPAVFSQYPLMLRLGGQYYVRSIQKVNEDSSLTFFCAIDEGLVLRLGRGENLVQNLQEAFDRVRLEVPNIILTIGCDCILRRLEVLDKSLDRPVNKVFRANNVIGFNTYGEQFQSVHINQTFTGVVIGE